MTQTKDIICHPRRDSDVQNSLWMVRVIFIWLTDKNLITIAAESQNNWLYTSAETNKKDVGAKRFLCTNMTFS